MTNPTAIAAPAVPQRSTPAGSDRHKQDAAANGPSFASVMRGQRGEADQGRTRSAAQGDTSRTKASDTADAATGIGQSDAEPETLGKAQHLPGLSALHRRDWHVELKTVTSGDVEPETADPDLSARDEPPAKGSSATRRHHERAANSNALPATSVLDAEAEAAEHKPTLGPAEHLEESNAARNDKPRKPQPTERTELGDAPVSASPDQPPHIERRPQVTERTELGDVPVSVSPDQPPHIEPLLASKADVAKPRAEKDSTPNATAPSSQPDSASPVAEKTEAKATVPNTQAGNPNPAPSRAVGAQPATPSSATSRQTVPASAAPAVVPLQPEQPTATAVGNAPVAAPTPSVLAPGAGMHAAAAPTLPATAQAAVTPTPATVKSSSEPAPHAFAVEMTVAAANYALASGKAGLDTERAMPDTAENAPETAVDTSAERPRVTVLPMRTQVATPGLSAGSFTLPPAFVADDQARQSAQPASATDDVRAPSADKKTPDDGLSNRAEPETGEAIQSRAPSVQAPAVQQAQASPTATVVAALAADPAARPQPVAALAQVLAPPAGSEPKTLTIQLHPAELGVVYATFQMTGGQMSVEISAETDEARSRLSAESHTIAKSLRSLGIDVDQVTVMQTTTPSPTVARTDDAGAQNLPSARDQQSSFGAQTSNGGGSRLGGQQNGRNGHDMAGAGRDQPSAADRGDGGVYI